MACNCGVRIINITPKCDSDKCLLIYDLRVGCNDGPAPCGGEEGTLVIYLTEYNVVTASPCDVVYSLKGWDTTVFDSVVLTSAGELTVVTSSNYVKSEEFLITYKVNSPCSLLSDTGEIWVCMKNLCIDSDCEGECDQCTGECIPVDPEISISTVTASEIKIQ